MSQTNFQIIQTVLDCLIRKSYLPEKFFQVQGNQSSSGQSGENPRLPFEVIEIGAAKLDCKFNIIDQYGSIIKPRVYRRLQTKIRELLNYDET